MYLPLLVVALIAAILAVVVVLATWRHPSPHAGLCADCGKPATHELTGKVTDHGIGFSATSETYCRRHAPENARRV